MMRERTTMYIGGPKVALPVNFSANVADALERNGWNQTYAANYKIAPDQKGKRVSPKTMSRLTRGAGGNQIGFILLRNIEIALGLPVSYPDKGWRMLPSGRIKIVDCIEQEVIKKEYKDRKTPKYSHLSSVIPINKDQTQATPELIVDSRYDTQLSLPVPKKQTDASNAEAVIDMIRELTQAEQDIVYLALKLTR
mgnify:CR=1 FL=1|tara:strand:+ start:876 stop:1460 length:585 start_codon:yes stop_codon:yes gene_type:complete